MDNKTLASKVVVIQACFEIKTQMTLLAGPAGKKRDWYSSKSKQRL